VGWPSGFRGGFREAAAARIAEQRGEHAADAYRAAALVAEEELADGRGGEPLHEAAEAFCDELERD
jgi:hypothetical protein